MVWFMMAELSTSCFSHSVCLRVPRYKVAGAPELVACNTSLVVVLFYMVLYSLKK